MTPKYSYRHSNKIVVHNLAPSVTVEILTRIFEEFGTVRTVKLMTDVMTGRCCGVGFVTLDEHVTGSALAALDGSSCEGRVIQVSVEHKLGRPIN